MKKRKDVQCTERNSNCTTSLTIYALKSRSVMSLFTMANGLNLILCCECFDRLADVLNSICKENIFQ